MPGANYRFRRIAEIVPSVGAHFDYTSLPVWTRKRWALSHCAHFHRFGARGCTVPSIGHISASYANGRCCLCFVHRVVGELRSCRRLSRIPPTRLGRLPLGNGNRITVRPPLDKCICFDSLDFFRGSCYGTSFRLSRMLRTAETAIRNGRVSSYTPRPG